MRHVQPHVSKFFGDFAWIRRSLFLRQKIAPDCKFAWPARLKTLVYRVGVLLKAQSILAQLIEVVLFGAKRYVLLGAKVLCLLKFNIFVHFVNAYEGWRCRKLQLFFNLEVFVSNA